MNPIKKQTTDITTVNTAGFTQALQEIETLISVFDRKRSSSVEHVQAAVKSHHRAELDTRTVESVVESLLGLDTTVIQLCVF